MTTSYDAISVLGPGALLIGKWNKNRYIVQRLIGEGANGRVYLAKLGRRVCAVKVGFNSLDLQSEVNAIKSLAREGTRVKEYYLESDDAVLNGRTLPFYAMKYIDGHHVKDFIAKRGGDWIYPIGWQLLSRLREMHQKGYVFCDLKQDNVLVDASGRLQLIDYGGVTRKGRSVRQFTELYDRGSWHAGTRIADEGYDLFSFALICLQVTDPQKELNALPLPQQRDTNLLVEVLHRCRLIPEAKELLRLILTGQCIRTDPIYDAWRNLLTHHSGHLLTNPDQIPWLKGAFVISALMLAGVILWIWIA